MPKSSQSLQARILWFAVGSVLNYILISTPFHWLAAHTRLPVWAIASSSVGFATVFFFGWNFLVNFRTDQRAGTALWRYLVAVLAMWILSSAVLTLLKHVHLGLSSMVGNIPLDFDVIGTQCFLAGLKFIVYHKWVFPASDARQL